MLARPPMRAEVLRRLVDSTCGVIKDLRDARAPLDAPDVFVANALTADTTPYFGVSCSMRNSGAGLTAAQARVAAVGESVERYACAYCDPGELVFGTPDALRDADARVVGPAQFPTFTHEQSRMRRRFAAFTPETPLGWARAHSLVHRAPALVPACVAYMPYKPAFADRGERELCGAYSTGLACGAGRLDAIYYGICECIERDAAMAFWWNRLPLPRIDIRGHAALWELFTTRFRRDHLEYVLLDGTTDVGVPAVLCLVIDRSYDPPLVAVGGAARLDAAEAVRKALIEGAHTLTWATALRRANHEGYRQDFADVLDFEDHVRLFASGRAFRALDFVLEQRAAVRELAAMPSYDAESYADAVRVATARVAAAGQDVLAMDLTTPDVRALGLTVTRAFVPGFVQLNAGVDDAMLANPRLYELPVKMGFRARPAARDELNPFPHPYP